MLDHIIIAVGEAAASAPAPVSNAAAAPAAGGMGFIVQLLPIIAVFGLMYILLILPERKRRKKLEEEMKSLKQGDKVMTNSGIIGTIDFIGDKSVYIKTADAKIEVGKEFIAGIIRK